jgi:glutamate synthase domain-containing protein 3
MTGGNVIILGETGKNFAAGMSGGIAYVLDENRQFDKNCNTEMVDLERVNDPEEKRLLRNWIERHREYTGSLKAKKLLENGDLFFKQFVKVMPIEYHAVLEAMKSKAA